MILAGWGEGRHDYTHAIWHKSTTNHDAPRERNADSEHQDGDE